MLRSILEGADGTKRNVVVMNAAAAMVVGGKTGQSTGLSALKEGAEIAADAIDSGRASNKLKALIELSQSYG